MWIMVPGGFVSIVEKPEDRGQDTLTVRARHVAHLVEFCGLTDFALEDSIIETESTDYPYRITMPRGLVKRALIVAVDELDYPNFKTRAKKVSGRGYESFLMRVWAAGLSLTSHTTERRLNLLYRAEDFS